ncbi:hypothetical protein NDU88_001431 [Pleurodeles waltl]|uniref:Uncharacterized protein n=1 Tax=Pleurodeles waltl TaxID=8319 RepID=A0AAV7VBV9_PLEWA|nr:hypothetical protein NDU88_001431 [Pleurodeles waltl]
MVRSGRRLVVVGRIDVVDPSLLEELHCPITWLCVTLGARCMVGTDGTCSCLMADSSCLIALKRAVNEKFAEHLLENEEPNGPVTQDAPEATAGEQCDIWNCREQKLDATSEEKRIHRSEQVSMNPEVQEAGT